MKVLHVTTDISETDVLRREFSAMSSDMCVECVGTARDAIQRLEAGTSRFDAVLLELTQINGEGLSLISHIRQSNLPIGVVAVTSARDDGPSREVLDSGADHIVVKGREFLTRLPVALAHAVARRTFEARLRVMLETAPVCLMRVAGDGNILAMNIAALDMVDAKRAHQVVDQSWYDRVAPDAQATCRDFIERATNGERGSLECQIEGLAGTRRWVVMHAVTAPGDADGAPSALVAIHDLDKTRTLEAGLENSLEQDRQNLEVLERELSEVKAQNQQLTAGNKAERVEWQQQSTTDLTAERAAWEQAEATGRQTLVEEHQAAVEALERALTATDAKSQQLTADHEAERAEWQQQSAADLAAERTAWEQAEATGRQTLVEEHQAAREALERALTAPDAKSRQLTADHETERAEWQQQSATDLTAERAAWEQAEATGRQTLVEEHQAAVEALERALTATEAQSQQLTADHEADRAEWQQQSAADGRRPRGRAGRMAATVGHRPDGRTRRLGAGRGDTPADARRGTPGRPYSLGACPDGDRREVSAADRRPPGRAGRMAAAVGRRPGS